MIIKKVIKSAAYLYILVLIVSCKNHTHKLEVKTKIIKNDMTNEIIAEKYYAWKEGVSYNNFRDYDTLVLDKLQTSRDEVLVEYFIKGNDSLKKFPSDTLSNMLYTIDVNGDKKQDIIFEGSDGSEAFVTRIYLNFPQGFKCVFSGLQYLKQPKFTDGKLASFILLNPGCCADPQIIEHHYSVSWRNELPEFRKGDTFLRHELMQKADNMFSSPQNFSIIADQSITREDCYLLPSIEDIPGNETGWFIKGDKGKALGWKYEEGRKWLFVMMNPPQKPLEWFPKEILDAYTYGWILKSDTDLK